MIARRVEAITDVIQIVGAFQRFAGPEAVTTEQLTAVFPPTRTEAVLVSDNEVGVSIAFQFFAVAASSESIGPDPLDLSKAEPPAGLRVIVDAQFVIRYRLTSGPRPSAEQLSKFGEVNSPLNLVPYWREFLDSSLRRAGMPPALAPVHRVEPTLRD